MNSISKWLRPLNTSQKQCACYKKRLFVFDMNLTKGFTSPRQLRSYYRRRDLCFKHYPKGWWEILYNISENPCRSQDSNSRRLMTQYQKSEVLSSSQRVIPHLICWFVCVLMRTNSWGHMAPNREDDFWLLEHHMGAKLPYLLKPKSH